jgi:hypothetical protein
MSSSNKKLPNKEQSCENKIKDAKKVLTYQNNMIKSQSDDMLLMVSLLNKRDKDIQKYKNNIDNNTQRLNYCTRDVEKYRESTSRYINIQFVLFIIFLILIVIIFFRFRKID